MFVAVPHSVPLEKTEPPAAGLWPGAHGHARFHGGYTPNSAEDVVGRLNSRIARYQGNAAAGDHVLSVPNVFILWADNLPAVTAKLISFAASH